MFTRVHSADGCNRIVSEVGHPVSLLPSSVLSCTEGSDMLPLLLLLLCRVTLQA
jgi:hypothetical protein